MKNNTGRPTIQQSTQRHNLEGQAMSGYNGGASHTIVQNINLSSGIINKLNWATGGIDGGVLGITPAMDGFVDEPTSFDGGEL